ncbi:hypothetical protein [Accumulibacter sp.]|uniref:Uncharacterized protein n=1 Tax=Candidatus Accumulibacter proximus TaxID=2954385 RepID=A0A935PYY7_9PROT|nr:hypothetical protein [Accumulibacter sp.]MBK7674938.1 hypothetical protein [Candidatus Accumulibacter proximus]MBL8374445.1 hypothetical protein [Accumulibacter sp.]
MKMNMQSFGEIEVEGARYHCDLVIEQGTIRKRAKGPSKAYRAAYGHTPLSADEAIPWHGKRLYIGTGMYGALPVMPAVYAAAEKKGIQVVARPTPEICGELQRMKAGDINAVLHVTC